MDFNRQNSRPLQRVTQPARPAAQPATPVIETETSPSYTRQTEDRKRYGLKHTMLIILMALVLLGGGYALGSLMPVAAGSEIKQVDSSKNQAVFLTNDQVYFGKIIDITDNVIVMKDIYYLQGPAQQNAGTNQPASSNQQQPDLALTKLGNELHGPEDRMQINRDQVLFWENLKSDGKVSEAIKAYKP